MKLNRQLILAFLLSLILSVFFSYRLLDVPMGFTADESAFGYNAALLARTGYDENHRFMPFFVLSINGSDWRQPVTQYYLAFLFKLFGASLFLLRFSSIIITIISFWLLYFLSRKLFKIKFPFWPLLIFLTTPLIMIQSHLALDNIMPIPFTLLWLISLYQFSRLGQTRYLILGALALGISFYTYKGMRAVVPVWFSLSLVYLWLLEKKPLPSLFKFSFNLRPYLWFIFTFFPFVALIPVLERLYPGAILGGSNPTFDSIYNFLYPFFSSFDLSFLFIRGDATPYHSTGLHGMFLLTSLPLFLLGIFISLKGSLFQRFLLVSFFTAPLLFGLVGSVHRASRLMCLIPLYCLISAAPFYSSIRPPKLVSALSLVIIVLNYFDFLGFYYSDYRKYTQNFVGDLKNYLSYQELKHQSIKLNLTPYVSQDLKNELYESVYFDSPLTHLPPDIIPPPGSLLLTNRLLIPGMTRLDLDLPYYHLQVTNDP